MDFGCVYEVFSMWGFFIISAPILGILVKNAFFFSPNYRFSPHGILTVYVSTDSFRRALRNGVSGIVKFIFGQKVNFSLIKYPKGKIVFPHNKLLIKYEF